MSEKMTLNVDTGSVLIAVMDRDEKIGEFRFNPYDLDIIKRYEQVAKILENLRASENPGPKEVLAFGDKIKEQFDYLFNYKVSDAIFAKCNPLTPLSDGEFYYIRVLDGIVGLMEKAANQRTAKISEATAKYRK